MSENLIAAIGNSIKSNWDIPSLADYNGKSFTYGEVARRIAHIHLLFEAAGVKPGDKVALCAKNSAEWACTFLAGITFGAIVVPLLHEFHVDNVAHLVTHSEACLLFTDLQIAANLDMEKMPLVKAVITLDNFKTVHSNDKAVDEAAASLDCLFQQRYPKGFISTDPHYITPAQDQTALINYTSGSAGYSKGVILTYGNLWANIDFALRQIPFLRHGDGMLSMLPLAHMYGLAFEFLFPFCKGCHITFLGRVPSPKVVLEAFAQVRPKLVITVPLVIEKIVKTRVFPEIRKPGIRVLTGLPGIRHIIFGKVRKQLLQAFGGELKELVMGGAALPAEVEDFLRLIKFPFTIGYGMTECAPLISYAPWNEFVPTSSGRVLDIMEARICKENPDDKLGEIQVRGENVMTGYYKNPEATKEVFTEDGWLRTGDLGTLDDDNNLYIRGRSKTMILSSSGQNIFPEEIEARLNNMPFVLESLVIERNKRLVALVYADYEALDSLGLNQPDNLKTIMDENLKNLNNSVAAYEKVSQIQLYPTEFEKTPKRSIKRYLYNSIAED